MHKILHGKLNSFDPVSSGTITRVFQESRPLLCVHDAESLMSNSGLTFFDSRSSLGAGITALSC